MGKARVDVLVSGLWQMTSTVVARDGACVVVDPGYFPREIEEVRRCALERGRVLALALTHGHWDHVLGHAAFPPVPAWCSHVLADGAARGEAWVQRSLDEARDFDSAWYVGRPAGHALPRTLAGLADGERAVAGPLALRALTLPGHSADGLGLLLEDEGLLLAGDYLSPVEIPFIDNVIDYTATLERLQGLLESAVRTVVPGHGAVLTAAEAHRIADEDLRYLAALREAAARGGRAAMERVPLPRAAQVAGMRQHHLDNVDKLLGGA